MTLEIKGNQIQIPFAIGQEVWLAQSSFAPKYITCPDCLGEKVLTILQGNGQKFTVDCAACRQGYDPPIGQVKVRSYEVYPMSFECKRVELSGSTLYYYDNFNNGAPTDRLFATKEECELKCKELNDEHTKEEERRAMANLESKKRDLAWSVHYWARKVKELEEDLERAKQRLNISKEMKAKP